MQEPMTPDNEEYRLSVLRELLILDTPIEESYDSIVKYTSTQFDVMLVMIAFMDADRNWFKSCSIDLGYRESPRKISFCGHTLLQPDIFEIPDTQLDERFSDNPLVREGAMVRYYAGVPIVIKGQAVGTLCLFDVVPHAPMAIEKRSHLKALANLLAAQMSWA
jgi:GAF domain-containing protein